MEEFMELKVTSAGEIHIVELSGELNNKTTPVAQEKLVPLAKPGSRIILDLSRVQDLSGAGLRLLLSLRRQLGSTGRLLLAGIPQDIKDTMATTGFLDAFSVVNTVDEAKALLNKFWEPTEFYGVIKPGLKPGLFFW